MFVSILTNGTIIAFLWLAILLILLFIGYKNANVVKNRYTYKNLLSGLLILVMFIFNRIITVNYLNLYPHEVTKFDKYAVFSLFIVVLVLLLLRTVITFILSKNNQRNLTKDFNFETIENIIQKYEGSYVSHLAFTGDKQFL